MLAATKHAELANCAILFALKLFGVGEDAARFVLPLLVGDDPRRMRSSSPHAVSFLKSPLGSDISESVAGQLRSVLTGWPRRGTSKHLRFSGDWRNA